MTVREFLDYATDDFYEVEFYDVNTGNSVVMSVRDAHDHDEIMDAEFASWDVSETLCINYDTEG